MEVNGKIEDVEFVRLNASMGEVWVQVGVKENVDGKTVSKYYKLRICIEHVYAEKFRAITVENIPVSK